ncbi:MAG: DUF3613 domain-containing protein [Comamonadaceae bacterium]|nr:MAG: DUF3613 domain-containing protein [Comamonadaceae bacterium]
MNQSPVRRLAGIVLLAACGAALPALGQDTQRPAQDMQHVQPLPSPSPQVGATTREWLALQRSGRAGASHPIPGEIATLSWRRYLESFRQPIPESFSSPLREAGDQR